MGMKWYVDILEEIVIQTLGKNFGFGQTGHIDGMIQQILSED